MSVKAELILDKTEFMYLEPVECVAYLHNNSDEVLLDVNSTCASGAPMLLLRNTETGEIVRGCEPRPESGDGFTLNVNPGLKLSWQNKLSEVLTIPAPGTYELRAEYKWADESAVVSDRVFLTVHPAHPREISIETLSGGWNYLSFSAWVNETNNGDSPFALWFSHLDLFTKPRITSAFELSKLSSPIQPVLSVAPNTDPATVWLGWIENGSFHYLYAQENFSQPQSIPLPEPDMQIIPPILEETPNPESTQHFAASVLLYSPLNSEGGRLLSLRIDNSGNHTVTELAAIPNLLWGKTAYLKDGSCHTFVVSSAGEQCILHRLLWNTDKGEAKFEDIDTVKLKFIAAHLRVMPDDSIRVLFLGENLSETRRYVIVHWHLKADEEPIKQVIDFEWSRSEKIDKAVIRVNQTGIVYALVCNLENKDSWFLIQEDGNVFSISEKMLSPIEILFSSDGAPVIFYVKSKQGFQFF